MCSSKLYLLSEQKEAHTILVSILIIKVRIKLEMQNAS